MDPATKEVVKKIPLLTLNAGPRDGEEWIKRLKQEYTALIKYQQINKEKDNDWFTIESNDKGTRWFGKCWYFLDQVKYEFDLEFDLAVTYPKSPPEIAIPEIDGKTVKSYRGGKICMTDHFYPLWAKNVPKFGVAHALALGLGPWLAAEVPDLVRRGVIVSKTK